MFSMELPSPIQQLQLPLLLLNNILALAIGTRNRVLQLGISLPVLVLLVSQSLYKERNGEWGNAYALECMVLSVTFTYVDWILLASPDVQSWRKIQYHDGKETEGSNSLERKDIVPQGFWRRAWWGLRLATTNRYVGWTSEVKNVPKEVPADYSRLLFVARKIARSAMFWLLSDAIKAYTASSSYGSWTDTIHVKVPISLAEQTFSTRFWFTWVHIFLTCTSLEHANAAYGAVSVALGLANPRDCPSSFGDLKELVTLRKAWSSVWHQNCRRLVSAPGIYISRDVLRLSGGSFASKYLQLFMGFGISAIVHGGASVFMNRAFLTDCAFRYFLGQALIIMIEDHVIQFAKSIGFRGSKFWRLIGVIWTVTIIGVTCQVWSAQVIDRGMWVHDRTIDVFSLGPPLAGH